MLLFKQKGVAYIHVPKTAGKKMRKVLISSMEIFEQWWGLADASGLERDRFDKVDRAHYTSDMIREFHPNLWDRILKMTCFSVARNPYHRAVSAYEQFKRYFGNRKMNYPVRSLSDYLSCIEDERHRWDRDGYMYIHGVPQVSFHMPCHKVICGSNLTASLSKIFGREIRFKSCERPCCALSADEQRLVERVYAEDMEIWERVRFRRIML